VNDPDQTMTWSVIGAEDDVAERPWPYGDVPPAEDRGNTVDTMGRFVSLAFIRDALKRGAWLWCATALVGLIVGSALFVKFPPAYQASTAVIVNDGPNVDTSVAIQTDAALAQSRPVAAQVVQKLGLTQSVSSFLAAYSVTPLTPQMLQITVNAPTSDEAVARASAVAAAYLQFRADYAQTQQQELVTELNQQVKQAQQKLDAVNSQISQASAGDVSGLSNLETQKANAENNLATVEQFATTTLASQKTTTNAVIDGSEVINPAAAVKHSRLKGAVLYVAGGLVGGLAVGLGLVIVLALTTDRLRRRDDVADALGAPVRLSVGTVRKHRWLPQSTRRAGGSDLETSRIVAYLRASLPPGSKRPAGLAVAAVDNAQVVARAVVALGISLASQDKQVIVADLSDGARAARLLGARHPGVHPVSRGGVHLTVAIPDRGEVAPIGPLEPGKPGTENTRAPKALLAASASADVVLTLATLDPAFGADSLPTWATDVVAVVTAGRSSAAKIHAVGEMVRLSGTRLTSAILVGADKNDESLGLGVTPEEPARVRSL
jgi:capsular polysaccharide biosynthesis protein